MSNSHWGIYNPHSPMEDTGDLFTDLANNVLDIGTVGGVEYGDVRAVNAPDDAPGDNR
jgi:hypothetical protein